MVDIFISMLSYALVSSVVQNFVFSGALGISESIRVAKKPRYLIMYGFWISFFAVSVPLIFRFIKDFIPKLQQSSAGDFLMYTAVLVVVYIPTALFCKFILRADKKYMNSLGLCAFNSLVVCLPHISGDGLRDIIGTAVGAAVAFVLSALIIGGGMKHFYNNPNIPEFFRGTPALFVYIGLICLALTSVSGSALF